MAISKVVLLHSFSTHPYMAGMLRSLASAFSCEGVETLAVDSDLDDEAIYKELSTLKPDFIFEINRTKNQSRAAIPEEIPHVAWIQDGWRERRPHERKQLHYTDPNFGGSLLTYTLIQPDYFGFSHHLLEGVWGRLHTGIDPNMHYPRPEITPVPNTAAICGYIPLPLHATNPAVMRHALGWNNGKKLCVDRVADFLLTKAKVSVCKHSFSDMHDLIASQFRDYLQIDISGAQLATSMDQTAVLHTLDTEMPRINDRLAIGDMAVAAGLDLAIYGSSQWLYWPKFVPYYRRNLRWQQELAQVYRETQVNMHNGCFGMHSRVLEGMGCGAPMFVCTGRFDDTEHDIKRHFQPGEHYIPFTIEEGVETLRHWCAQPARLREIGMNAAEEAHARHTWRHRVQEVLSDISSLQDAPTARSDETITA
ncbi:MULTISPECIES: glycosyltransferase [unclassified Paludibacterium]|uniref:glycosyltransferase family protein n=1 Tax=unclassified Paludibacterium TaxID=2618429 RepID=UPI001C03BD85|nr:glycosyltransferase [Paludibacterium sp. B53371]BEV72214.1 hypothetical protein THUN1379_16960 [Paludibacterium sp. THUN1379]